MGLAGADSINSKALVRVYSSFDKLPSGYATLFQESGQQRSFFLSQPWFTHLHQSGLDAAVEQHIYGLEFEEAALAALPMWHRPSPLAALRPKVLTAAANFYSALFGPVLSAHHAQTAQLQLDVLIQAMASAKPRWDVIDLHPLEKESEHYAMLLKAFSHAGMPATSYFCAGNWFLKVNNRSYQEYFSSLPSQLKNTVKRKSEALRKSDRLQLVIAKKPDDVAALIESYQQIYRQSWKQPEPFPEFVPGWIAQSAKQGWLRLGIATIDGQPAAAQIWLVHQNKASIYKLAYDEQFAHFSIGSILTAHLFAHVIDNDRVSEVDFLNGDERYKQDWMSDRREYWGIVAYNTQTWKGRSAYLIEKAADYAKRIIRQSKRITTRST